MENGWQLRTKGLKWKSPAEREIHGVWYVALGAALWGMDPLFRILLLKTFTSAQIVLLEHLLLACYAVPVFVRLRNTLTGKLSLAIIGALLFVSWGGSALATVLFTAAFNYGNFNAVLLLQKLQPLFAILLARVILKEALPVRFAYLLPLAIGGTYLLTFGFGLPSLGFADLGTLSCLFSILAAALWGGSTAMGKFLLQKKLDSQLVTSLRFLLALPLLAAVLWVRGDAWHVSGGTVSLLLLGLNLLFQAFLPGLVSMLFYYKGLSSTKAIYATLAELSFPAVGIFVNWIVLHQPLTAGQLLGFLLIWSTLFMMSRSPGAAAQTPAQASVQV
ncbi:MAG: protein of unknown function transrane [Paenibacillaceae bacterium]|nr:protein of unknown function transrane [Paenibacillaceae bacterium]